MALNRGKLANIDRRLLAELNREESWQVVKVPISDASWSTWKRYCDVVGLSMGRAIAALIDSELSSVVDDEVESGSAVMAERERILDEREQKLARREQELDRHVQRSGRRPSRRDLERLAGQIEPPDPGWTSTASSATVFDPEVFKGVGRNEPCPCRSGLKFKNCHWDWYRHQT